MGDGALHHEMATEMPSNMGGVTPRRILPETFHGGGFEHPTMDATTLPKVDHVPKPALSVYRR